ncbi:MAG: T9SS type A sorting domain-containing protein [Mucilaginibacter sp.]|uniref:T9SS type A sorting domain-containing protein n=1 Tax=Mucilaginibacter sp. TaxID=1882438 RepID=UPI0034E55E33
MKKLLLFSLLGLLFNRNLQAQETPDDFSNRVKSIFQYVNTSPVNTGILLDCGVDFLNLDNFNGTTLVDSNFVSMREWRSIYGSLLTSQFNNQVSFTSFPAFNSTLNSYVGSTQPTPFAFLYYNYQVLRSDAINAGLMYASNDQLYDVANRSQSPYVTKTAFAIAPQKDYFTAVGGSVSFVFPTALMFGNTGKSISQLKINLDDGNGLRNVAIGSAFTATYSTGGLKNVTYEVTFNDYTVLTSHSKIYIEKVAEDYYAPGGGDYSEQFHARTNVDLVANTSNGTKRATLQIRLSNNHANDDILKPLIVVEGIDFWRITGSPDFTVNQFLLNLAVNQFPNNDLLSNQIDIAGYDIIFVNFDEGTAALEDNAQLVQQAITWVNNNKTGTTQNVVMGLSMGCVLSRYVLRTMEINGIPHNTRLFVSMDGPHQGGNFPLSLQALVKNINTASLSIFQGAFSLQLRDMFPEVAIANSILNTPAAKQLLIYRIGDGNNLPIDNTIHDNFYSTYHALGMPSCRNIAISNGSECGTTQNYPPLTTLFEMKMEKQAPGGLANIFDFFTTAYQVAFGLFTNRPLIGLGSLLGTFSTKTSFVVDFQAKALPDHSTQQIYKGFVGVKRKILFLFTVNSSITNRTVNAQSYMLPLDTAPGGLASFAGGGGIGLPSGLSDIIKVSSVCFVPTVSALDIGSGNSTINTSQLNSAYSIDSPPANPYNTPFNNFVTAVRYNEEHLTFGPRNGDFILKELNSTTTGFGSCALFCNTNLITGSPSICSTANYYINSLPANASVSWTASPSNAVSITQSNNVATVTPQGNASITLTALVKSACGDIPIVKPVVVSSSPTITSINYYQSGSCYNGSQTWYLQATPSSAGATNWHWYVDNPSSGTFYIQSPNSQSTYITVRGGGGVSVTYTDQCGNTSTRSGVTIYSPCGTGSSIASYPNPADQEMTVSYQTTSSPNQAATSDADTQSKPINSFSVELYNDKGKVLKSGKSSNGKGVVLNTADIQNGNYFLHVKDGKEVIKKQVVIHHP